MVKVTRQDQIRKYLRAYPNSRVSDIAKGLGISPKMIDILLMSMNDVGEDKHRLILVNWGKHHETH